MEITEEQAKLIIEEDNKLIAEFMQLEYEDGLYYYTTLWDDHKTDTLYFNCSWDWLMPVANKIIKSRDEQNADWDLSDLKYALSTANIDLVYKEVVRFVIGNLFTYGSK